MRVDALLLESPEPEPLVRCYRDAVGLPLEEERHGSERHWGCLLEGVHVAIHPGGAADGARNLAFSLQVDDVDRHFARLRDGGAPVHLEPEDRPYGRLAAVRDPDGNVLYLHRYPARS